MAGHENSVTTFLESLRLSQFLRGIEAFGDQLGLVCRDGINRTCCGGGHESFLSW